MKGIIKVSALFVDRRDGPPWHVVDMRVLHPDFFGFGVVYPAVSGFHVHGAEFPLFEWAMHATEEANLLFCIGDGKPVYKQFAA